MIFLFTLNKVIHGETKLTSNFQFDYVCVCVCERERERERERLFGVQSCERLDD